jgi:hypothetical protein
MDDTVEIPGIAIAKMSISPSISAITMRSGQFAELVGKKSHQMDTNGKAFYSSTATKSVLPEHPAKVLASSIRRKRVRSWPVHKLRVL